MEICKDANTEPSCRSWLWLHKMLFVVSWPALKVPTPFGSWSLFPSLCFCNPPTVLPRSHRIQVKGKPNTFIFSWDNFTDLLCSAALYTVIKIGMRDSCWTAAWRWQYVIRSGVGRGWDHLPPALCGQRSHVRLHRIGESLSLQTPLGWPWLWDLHPWLQKPLYRTLWPPSPTAIRFYPILLSVLLVQRFQLLLGPAALREDNGKTPFWRKTFLVLFFTSHSSTTTSGTTGFAVLV